MFASTGHRGNWAVPNSIAGLVSETSQIAFDDTTGLVVRDSGRTTSDDLVRLVIEKVGAGAGASIGAGD